VHLFALDFDGVICDSAGETAASAWRSGQRIWPEWRGADPPDEACKRFRRLRPVIETGHEAIILMRLIQAGVSDRAILGRFSELCTSVLVAEGLAPDELTQLFGETRDRWIARDSSGWLARHRFYPTVVAALTATLRHNPVFILTTKQRRFAMMLLRAQGLVLPEQRVLGLEEGKSKEDSLGELKQRPEFHGMQSHFVEDRLATLERAMAREALKDLRLYLAAWGYNTSAERRRAAAMARITLWKLRQFLKV
jgi:phosphoglycolate phosphatase-like HAD superfamily hydrolase